jgi:hypothetical protein
MVMSTQPQEADEPVEVIEPVEIDTQDVDISEETEAPVEDVAPADIEAPAASVEPTASVPDGSPPPPPPPPSAEQQAINELQERRAAEAQRQWQQQVISKAKQFEQQLNDEGYMPEQARAQARRYVQQEQRFRQHEQEASDMVGFLAGRQAAAIHFMKQHGLANTQMLNDLMALQQVNSPAEMDKEARRMKRERALIAENTRLKQGRVAPQTFDNSQGSAEVTTNQDRLLQAYMRGDRSDAATQAARNITFGA